MAARIVFMGSPDFAVPILQRIAETYPVVGVVTQPDRPAGRGRRLTPPPVRLAADRLGLPSIQPHRLSEPEAMAALTHWAPEVIIVAAFGQILRAEVLSLPQFGCLNVHASLLPRWRGAAPIQAALLNGDAKTGDTIMKMDQGIDTGPILVQRSIGISSDDTANSLADKLAELGAELLMETLPSYLTGRQLSAPQDNVLATYAPMIKKEAGHLDWNLPAVQLERMVRAFNPWPGAFTDWKNQPLKIHRAHVVATERSPVGKRMIVNGLPAVSTLDGLLVMDELQPAGRKIQSGEAFLHGTREWEI